MADSVVSGELKYRSIIYCNYPGIQQSTIHVKYFDASFASKYFTVLQGFLSLPRKQDQGFDGLLTTCF